MTVASMNPSGNVYLFIGLNIYSLIGLVISVALLVFFLVCLAKVFRKAGQAAWKAFVPVYNIYTFFKIMSDEDMFWGQMLTAGMLIFLGCVIPASFLKILLLVAGLIVSFGFHIHLSISGCPRFGKGKYTVGMIFLPVIFTAILAFSDAEYNVYSRIG